MTHYLDKLSPELETVRRATFPAYNGKKFKLSTNVPSELNSYWDGGSRDFFAFYDLITGRALDVHSNHPMFEGMPRNLAELPSGVILVMHTISCGHNLGLTFFVRADNLTAYLPPAVELTDDEKIVLKYTRSYKSSYAGIANYRLHEASRETGITLERWNLAREACIGKGLLNKAGALTPSGKNALGSRF